MTINFGNAIIAGGTVDAITATMLPSPTIQLDILPIYVRTLGPNATTTPTINLNGTGAKAIVKKNNVALAAGDLVGVAELSWDAPNDRYVLMNPQAGGGGGGSQTLADTLALGAATNNIPITSNDELKSVNLTNVKAIILATNVGVDKYTIISMDENTLDIAASDDTAGKLTSIQVTPTATTISATDGGDNYSSATFTDSVAQMEAGGVTGGGYVNVVEQKTTAAHDVLIELNAPSVKKNGVEVATEDYVDSYAAPLVSQLKPTALKSSSYTAAPGDLVPADSTGGVVPITLPTNPADGTIIAVKRVIGPTNNVTVTTGGSDVLNISGGATLATISQLNQQLTFVYSKNAISAGVGIWIVETSLSLTSLDTRFNRVYSPIHATTTVTHTGTTSPVILFSTSVDLSGKVFSQDILYIMALVQASNTANTKTLLYYISDSPTSLVNQVLIGTSTRAAQAIQTEVWEKVMVMTAINTQNVIAGVSNGLATGAAMSTTAIDFSVANKYCVLVGQLANATDTMKLHYINSRLSRP